MLKTKNLMAWLAVGSALTLVACGDDDSGTGGASGIWETTPEQYIGAHWE